MSKKPKKMSQGRPTKYKEEYCKTIVEFFDVPHTREVEKTRINKDGTHTKWFEEVANSLPTFERFAVDCGVHVDTLHEWRNKYDSFSEACKRCKNIQRTMLNDLAMRGFYNATYTMFVAKNITDMRDTQHIEQNSNVRNTTVVTDKEVADEASRMKEELNE